MKISELIPGEKYVLRTNINGNKAGTVVILHNMVGSWAICNPVDEPSSQDAFSALPEELEPFNKEKKMREVVVSIPPSAVRPVDEVKLDRYYGVDLKGTKAFITREFFDAGQFVVRSGNHLTNANGYGYSNNTLENLIKSVINTGNTVYEFDSFEDLAHWLLGK